MARGALDVQIPANVFPRRERGVVLVVALVLLLVLTLIGLSTMESSGMEMKMANQSRERLVAMQAAEAGLHAAESFIESTGFSDAELDGSDCGAGHCFKADCSGGGYCFSGTNASDPDLCTLTPTASPAWENESLWKTSGRHHQLLSDGLEAEVKYIVEFLCHIPNSATDSAAPKDHFLFRITSLATVNTAKSRVMLQSTYKVKAS